METQTFENPGVELDKKAKAYAREHRVSYAEALREVGAEDPALLRAYALNESPLDREARKGAAEFSRRVRAYSEEWNLSRAEAAARVVLHDPAMRPYAAGGNNTALQEVGVLIAGLPKFKDGSVDFEAAARVLNSDPDYQALARKAAGEWLDRETRALIDKRGLHGAVADNYGAMLREAMSENPEVAALYNGGRVTAEALRTIYLQLTN